MLTLVNSNFMLPPIAPVGLDYIAEAVSVAGWDVELVDLALADDKSAELTQYFQRQQPELIGISFRNVDDCFWPSAQSFLPILKGLVADLRELTDAPIVLGGVGYSMFARAIVQYAGVDFGIHGDGEQALVSLLRELRGQRQWDRVPGLVYWRDGTLRANSPAWPHHLTVPVQRGFIDNRVYFRRGGQVGVETKRGCHRRCIYCAEPLAKGTSHRLRDPSHVADEIDALLGQGVDVLHLCDSEFNLPLCHAEQVCEELIRRDLGRRVRWYAYLAITPFTRQLAQRMQQAGCVGINFTSDSAHHTMLRTYRQPHRREDLAQAVQTCREFDIAVMFDLLLGGPGETPETISESIEAVKQINPDCAGAALGIRVYPGTPIASLVLDEGPMATNPSLRRNYDGPIDFLQPTFYISTALGRRPGQIVRELIGDDDRFFPPQEDVGLGAPEAPTDHNYNENRTLVKAIDAGARGAYWDILRRLRAVGHT